MKFDKRTLTVFIIMITEFLGFSLILPFLPLYAQDMGASPLLIGILLASFPACQFFASPITGRLSDHYGRKPLLILSQLITGLSFLILGLANGIGMLFLARMLDGIFGSNHTVAQAYLSDISSEEDRSKAMGLSGAAMGMGMLVGPAAGGYLARISFGLPGFIAAGLCLVSILMIVFLLPETVERKTGHVDLSQLHLGAFTHYFRIPQLATSLWTFSAYMVAHAIFASMFSLYIGRQFAYGTAQVGLLLTYVAVINVIVQMGLLSLLIKALGEERLKRAGMAAIVFGMGLAAFAHGWVLLLIALALFSFGLGAASPTLMGDISRKAPADEQGAIMGVSSSINSLSGIVSPLVGGLVMNYLFPGSVMLVGAVVMAIGLLLVIRRSAVNASGEPIGALPR